MILVSLCRILILPLLILTSFCAERKEIVNSVLAQVEEEFDEMRSENLTEAETRMQAFKSMTAEARAQGMAMLKLERMVRIAEKKIFQKQRQAKVQTSETLAESLAMEVFHKPGSLLTKEELKVMIEQSGCESTITTADCSDPQAVKHRMADGTCNNLENPTWGAANTQLRRLLPPRYEDGITRPRGFLQSQDLLPVRRFSSPIPSPRVCSTDIMRDTPDEDLSHTYILMQWGQFIDHDLDSIPSFPFRCPRGCRVDEQLEGICYPFPVPANDTEVAVTRIGSEAIGCHSFTRSLAACPEPSEMMPRQQLNQITHWLDGSAVYHHDPNRQRNAIRDTSSNAGLLRTGIVSSGESLECILP